MREKREKVQREFYENKKFCNLFIEEYLKLFYVRKKKAYIEEKKKTLFYDPHN